MKTTKSEQLEALNSLRELVQEGDTIFTIVRHVSRSGMSRRISPIIFKDGEPLHLAYMVAQVLGWKYNDDQSITVHGCGMDMGFHLIYELATVLFPEYRREGNAGSALVQRWL